MRTLLPLLLVVLVAACGDGSLTEADRNESDGSSTSTSTHDEPDGATIGSEDTGQQEPVGELTAEEELRDARARWEAAAITDYTVSYQPVCFCEQALLTGIVVNGVGDGQGWLDVETMFEQLETALSDGVASFSAEYDPTLGYPTDYYIDFDRMTADEEFGVAGVVVVATS